VPEIEERPSPTKQLGEPTTQGDGIGMDTYEIHVELNEAKDAK